MSDPKKPAPPPAPTPDLSQGAPPPAAAPADAESKLALAKAKLAKLKAEKELDIVLAEIERLQHGGKPADQVAREKAAEKLRDATHKETDANGKSMAKYRITEPCFKPDLPGGPPKLRPAGFIITVDADTLPGVNWQAVAKVPNGPAVAFADVKV